MEVAKSIGKYLSDIFIWFKSELFPDNIFFYDFDINPDDVESIFLYKIENGIEICIFTFSDDPGKVLRNDFVNTPRQYCKLESSNYFFRIQMKSNHKGEIGIYLDFMFSKYGNCVSAKSIDTKNYWYGIGLSDDEPTIFKKIMELERQNPI